MSLRDNIELAIARIPGFFIHHYSKGNDFDSIHIISSNGSSLCRLYWFHDDNSTVLLDWLSVSEDFRNRGIATDLQILRESMGVIMGAKYSCLWVVKDSWMQKWYERRGYKYHSDYKAEKNAVWMKKRITTWQ